MRILFRRFNDSAREARARITRRIGFQVVRFFMHDHRFSDDRIWAAQIQFPFPNEVSLAGSVDFNVAEIADVTLGRVRSAMMFMHRIKMPAGGRGIRRRAIPFFVNMEAMFARFEVLNISHDLHLVAFHYERDRASGLAS